jgi:hypothetical protein
MMKNMNKENTIEYIDEVSEEIPFMKCRRNENRKKL